MKEKQDTQNLWRDSLLVFTKISGWVVTPVIICLFLGRYLDTRFGTKPFIFLGLTAFAFLISCFGIYKETMQYMRDLEKKNGNNTRNNDNNA